MKKTTQHPRAHRRSIGQPPASGQRPKQVTHQNVKMFRLTSTTIM